MVTRREAVELGLMGALAAALRPAFAAAEKKVDAAKGEFANSVLADMKLRKIKIDIGLNAPFKVVQATDSHFTYVSAEDFEKLDGKAMEWYKFRSPIFAGGIHGLAAALLHAKNLNAPLFHTGDLLDFPSKANLDMLRRDLSNRNWFYSMGNHEYHGWGPGKPAIEIGKTAEERAAGRKLFEQYNFNSVIHFAAYKAVGESVSDPMKYYRNNLLSFMNVVDLMREFGRPNIVFSSSATVYGEADELPVTELTPRKPATSSYGNTKQMCEDILRDSTAAYDGLKGIALRYFNPIGAHPSALIGELPRGVPQNLVPFITQTAAGVRECLSVFGDDYDTPDGSCLRDYIDVVDLAKAHVVAITRMVEGKNKQAYEIFNVGTGNGVSVLELVGSFERVNELKLNYKIAPRRPGDVVAIWADTTLANEELGWKAERSLDDTLRSAWAWEKNVRGIK